MAPTNHDGPAFGRPVLFSVFLSAAAVMLIQAGGVRHIARLREAGEEVGLDLIGIVVTQPITHLVLVPGLFFLVYTAVQILGYRAELSMLETRHARPAMHTMWRLAGRGREAPFPFLAADDSPFVDAVAYTAFQSRIDRRLHRPIEFAVGAMTMLGLLGTIVGLSLALQDLPAVMSQDASDQERTEVLQSLGFAFVTTIIGVIASLILSVSRLFLANMIDRAKSIVETQVETRQPPEEPC